MAFGIGHPRSDATAVEEDPGAHPFVLSVERRFQQVSHENQPRRCYIAIELLIILLLVLLNGVFAGAEIAVISVRRTRLAEMVETGSRSARAVADLRAHPERFLATVQIGITVVAAAAAAFGGSSLEARLTPWIERVPLLAPYAEQIALFLIVALVSYLSLVLGELVPKSLALRFAETYALVIGGPLLALAWLARPLVWTLTASSNVVLRIFGDRTSFTETRHSPEELMQLVEEAALAGTVDAHAGQIAARALGFADLQAESVMVPRHAIAFIGPDATAEELATAATEHSHSRMVVYDRENDEFVGVVNVRDALARARLTSHFQVKDLIHPVPIVPPTLSASTLLRDLQRDQSHLALIADEAGTVRGLVTLEDLVEELVGDILSEGDVREDWPKHDTDGSILLPGSLPIHEVNRELNLSLREDGPMTTLAGLCIAQAGRIPKPGEHLRMQGLDVEIVEANKRRIKTIRLRPLVPPST